MEYLIFIVSLILSIQVSGGSTYQATAMVEMTLTTENTTSTSETRTTTTEQRAERFVFESDLPTITNLQENVTVYMHHNITIHCEATGVPAPNVTWMYRKYIPLERIYNTRQIGNDLYIQDATKQNQGPYDCLAVNKNGGVRRTTTVSVILPLEVKLLSPLVVLDPLHMGVGVLVVNSRATGEPTPTITWSKYNSTPIVTDSDYLVSPNGELVISGMHAFHYWQFIGIYTCKAENKISSAVVYQIIALRIFYKIDETSKFTRFGVTPGLAFQALCLAGTTEPDGSPINKEFDTDDIMCVSARKVGAIGKEAGNVTWIIKPNGHPEFVDLEKGKLILE